MQTILGLLLYQISTFKDAIHKLRLFVVCEMHG